MRTLGNSLSLRIALFLPPFPEAPRAGGDRRWGEDAEAEEGDRKAESKSNFGGGP